MSERSIEPQARLIAALAERMGDAMWASDILFRCKQIEEAVERIRQVARSREGGER